MTVREFHSCLRDSCRPVYFVSVLFFIEVVSVSVDAQYGHVQSLCWLVCQGTMTQIKHIYGKWLRPQNNYILFVYWVWEICGLSSWVVILYDELQHFEAINDAQTTTFITLFP